MSEPTSPPKASVNLAGASPDTGIDLTQEFGFTPHGGAFTVADDFTLPSFCIMDQQFAFFGKLDTSGPDPVELDYDPVGLALRYEFLPNMRRFISTALRSSGDTIPTESDLADYFYSVEEAYACIAFFVLMNHLLEDFDWAKARQDGVSEPPAEFRNLCEVLYCDKEHFQWYWGPLITRLMGLPALPNVLDLIDQIYSAFYMTPNDRVLRIPSAIFKYFVDQGGDDTARAACKTYIGGLIDDCETTYVTVATILQHYIPFKAGVPSIRFNGVSPLQAQGWWNFCRNYNDLYFLSTTPYLTRNGLCAKMEGVTAHPTTSGAPQDGLWQIDTYRDRVSVMELLYIPLALHRYTSAPNYGSTIMGTQYGGQIYIVEMTTSGVGYQIVLVYQTYMSATDNPQPAAEHFQYMGVLENRFQFLPGYLTGMTGTWVGMRHGDMTPCKVHNDAYRNMMRIVYSQLAGIKWVAKLIAVVAGSYPRAIHPSLAAAYLQNE